MICKTCGKPYKKDRYNRNDCLECIRAKARANYHKQASTRNGAVKPEDYMPSWRGRGYDEGYVRERDDLLAGHEARVQADLARQKKKPRPTA